MPSEPVLSSSERAELAKILAPFADRIESVGVFGSRATGLARANSDIDLVLYGDVDAETEGRLWTLFQDSDLPVEVDLVCYERICHDGLRRHIDACVKTIFETGELKALRDRIQGAERTGTR